MWVFMSGSMLSIVEPPNAEGKDRDMLLVRARAKGDIERVFSRAQVSHTPERDYAYRALLPRSAVAKALAQQVKAIDYRNFKASVAEADRHDAYADAWKVMLTFQARREAARAKARRATRHNSFLDGGSEKSHKRRKTK